jgi:uncharacterized protein YggU (UPF0235/DUF167 family)
MEEPSGQCANIAPNPRKGKTMDELVRLVAKKTKLPEAQAKVAVETVIGFLKSKLPAPVASQKLTVC